MDHVLRLVGGLVFFFFPRISGAVKSISGTCLSPTHVHTWVCISQGPWDLPLTRNNHAEEVVHVKPCLAGRCCSIPDLYEFQG